MINLKLSKLIKQKYYENSSIQLRQQNSKVFYNCHDDLGCSCPAGGFIDRFTVGISCIESWDRVYYFWPDPSASYQCGYLCIYRKRDVCRNLLLLATNFKSPAIQRCIEQDPFLGMAVYHPLCSTDIIVGFYNRKRVC